MPRGSGSLVLHLNKESTLIKRISNIRILQQLLRTIGYLLLKTQFRIQIISENVNYAVFRKSGTADLGKTHKSILYLRPDLRK